MTWQNIEAIYVPFSPTCVKCQYSLHSLSPWIPCAEHMPKRLLEILDVTNEELGGQYTKYSGGEANLQRIPREPCTHEDEGTEVGNGFENIERTYYGYPGYGYKFCPDCGLDLEFDESLREDDTQREPL